MGNPLDGDARQSAGKTNRESGYKGNTAMWYCLYASAAEFAVCRNFLLLWNKSGAKIGEGVIFSGYDRQTKEKIAAKAQGC